MGTLSERDGTNPKSVAKMEEARVRWTIFLAVQKRHLKPATY